MEREDIERPFYTADLTVDDQEIWTPVLDVKFNDTVIQLHQFNCLVRVFETESANHVEWRTPKGVKGIRMAQELMDMMIEYDYSYRWDLRVDDSTNEWLAGIEAANLDRELGELFDES